MLRRPLPQAQGARDAPEDAARALSAATQLDASSQNDRVHRRDACEEAPAETEAFPAAVLAVAGPAASSWRPVPGYATFWAPGDAPPGYVLCYPFPTVDVTSQSPPLAGVHSHSPTRVAVVPGAPASPLAPPPPSTLAPAPPEAPPRRASARMARSVRLGSARVSQADLVLEPSRAAMDARTTVMLRNLPNRYSRSDLLERLSSMGLEGSFDVLYLPLDYRSGYNLGYAFVNALGPAEVSLLGGVLSGLRWEPPPCSKVAAVCYARVQGRDALINHLLEAHFPQNPESQPLVFVGRDHWGRATDPVPLSELDARRTLAAADASARDPAAAWVGLAAQQRLSKQPGLTQPKRVPQSSLQQQQQQQLHLQALQHQHALVQQQTRTMRQQQQQRLLQQQASVLRRAPVVPPAAPASPALPSAPLRSPARGPRTPAAAPPPAFPPRRPGSAHGEMAPRIGLTPPPTHVSDASSSASGSADGRPPSAARRAHSSQDVSPAASSEARSSAGSASSQGARFHSPPTDDGPAFGSGTSRQALSDARSAAVGGERIDSAPSPNQIRPPFSALDAEPARLASPAAGSDASPASTPTNPAEGLRERSESASPPPLQVPTPAADLSTPSRARSASKASPQPTLSPVLPANPFSASPVCDRTNAPRLLSAATHRHASLSPSSAPLIAQVGFSQAPLRPATPSHCPQPRPLALFPADAARAPVLTAPRGLAPFAVALAPASACVPQAALPPAGVAPPMAGQLLAPVLPPGLLSQSPTSARSGSLCTPVGSGPFSEVSSAATSPVRGRSRDRRPPPPALRAKPPKVAPGAA